MGLLQFAGIGVRVTPTVRDHTTKVLRRGSPFTHRVVLQGFYADSPARVKLLNCLSMSAYMGCFYCWMTGKHLHGSMRWAGYSEPVSIERGGRKGRMLQMGVHDQELRVTPDEHVMRVGAVEQGLLAPDFIGVHGGCIIAKMLPYVDIISLFLVPINHALHRGVFRDLVLELLQPLQQLKKLHDQHAAIAAPGPLGRAEQVLDQLKKVRIQQSAIQRMKKVGAFCS